MLDDLKLNYEEICFADPNDSCSFHYQHFFILFHFSLHFLNDHSKSRFITKCFFYNRKLGTKNFSVCCFLAAQNLNIRRL